MQHSHENLAALLINDLDRYFEQLVLAYQEPLYAFGSLISSADTDGNSLVWQASTGKPMFKYKLNLFLPSLFIPTHLAFLVWSPDGSMLAIASDEGTIAVIQAG